jgi:ATP-dependent DNA helicase RecG
LVTLFQYYEGGVSECRNTLIQKMFTMIGSAERAGSGVGKILSGWDSSHWRRPSLFVESKPDRLELYLPMTSTIPENTLAELKFLFGDVVNTLNKDELMILSTCQIEGEVNNQRLRYLVDQHKTEITKLLKDLCKAGFLLPENKGRWTTYHLNKEGSSKQGSLNEDSSKQGSLNEDSSKRGSSIQGNTIEDSSKQGSSKQGSSKEDSLNEDSSKEGSSNRDSLNRDSSNRDSFKHKKSTRNYGCFLILFAK